ncbi:hypothetical protein CKM354_001219100 [Cercospora kikuchii]|uniref:DUF7605 domain-containing protein n=1 Tax=Cercospora kikuchii TaxID=84275 RepID=A0A9P3FLI9_9PEZI|nr:uncharacterized protein CKM354_001219100 [Cercospora kikuchii]GIZ49155.1 hypothetical protein CKM354_001219100 [Cercospora kikuchii]
MMTQHERGRTPSGDEMPPLDTANAQPQAQPQPTATPSKKVTSAFPGLSLGEPRKRRHTSPLFVKEEDDSDTSPPAHVPDTKRTKFDITSHDSGSCRLRCGHPLDSPIHRHFPWCHPNVPMVEDAVLDICEQLLTRVQERKSGVSDSIMAKCRAVNACKNLKLLYPVPKPAALIGGMGVGKSQLVNGLLGLPGAAITSDSSRGTNTTLEFQGRRENQSHKFVLEVLLQTPDQIKARLRDYCHTIHGYLALKIQESDGDEEVDDREVAEQRKKYNTVYDMLYTTLYGSTLTLTIDGEDEEHEATDLDDFKAFLDSALDGNARIEALTLDDTIKALYGNIADFMRAQGVSRSAKTCAVDSLEDLEEAMHETIKPASAETDVQHLWPLVRKAVLYCDGIELLDMGVSIGDTAGFADTNEFVVNNTLAYLSQAGTILVVAPVLRIANGEELNSQLTTIISLGKANGAYVVATKTDLLKSSLKPAEKKKLSEQDAAKIKSAEERLQELELESEKLRQEKQHLLDTQQWEQHSKFNEDPEELKLRKATASREVTRAVRAVSQRKIALELKDKIRKLTRSGHGPDLKVLFATTKGLDNHNEEGGDKMSEDALLDTGVPAIAQLLLERPARERFEVMWRTCTKRLPSELQAISNILTKTPGEMHRDVRASIVNRFDAGIEHVVNALADELQCRFGSHLAQAFTEDNKAEWRSKAGPKLDKWAQWHPITVHAYFKKEGYWKPRDSKDIKAWNYEIQNVLATPVIHAFEEMDSDCEAIMETLANHIKDFILKPLRQDTSIASLGEQGYTLTQTITDQSDELETDLGDFGEALNAFLDFVCRRATFKDKESYVHEELKSTYLRAAALSQKDYPKFKKDKLVRGNTAHGDRIHLLRDKICLKGPNQLFERVQTRTETGLEEASKEWVRNVRKRLEAVKTAVLEDFDSRYETHEETNKMDATTTKVIYDATMLAKSRLTKEVLPLLEECKTLNEKVVKDEPMEED